MRLEPETEPQEKMDVWIADMKNERKETMACQDAMEESLEKMGPKSRRKGGHSGAAGDS
jgi:hypothetical protein